MAGAISIVRAIDMRNAITLLIGCVDGRVSGVRSCRVATCFAGARSESTAKHIGEVHAVQLELACRQRVRAANQGRCAVELGGGKENAPRGLTINVEQALAEADQEVLVDLIDRKQMADELMNVDPSPRCDAVPNGSSTNPRPRTRAIRAPPNAIASRR